MVRDCGTLRGTLKTIGCEVSVPWPKGIVRIPEWLGFDLRNEVRADGLILPTWGSGDLTTDWSAAAIKGAKEVLSQKPDLLIVVSGIHFGMRLSEVPNRPIHDEVPALWNRTIYTTHFYYGWSFDLMAYDMLGRNIPVLMSLTCWLWCLLAADATFPKRFQERYEAAEQQDARACFAQWELFAAAALFGLQAVLFMIGEHLGQSCGHIHIVSPPAFVVATSVGFHIGYVLWIRILLGYTLVLFTTLSKEKDTCQSQFLLQEHAVSEGNMFLFLGNDVAEAIADAQRRLMACILTIGRLCASEILVRPLRQRKIAFASGAASLLALVFFTGSKCGSYSSFQGELNACLGPLLSGDGVTPAPVWLSEFGTDVSDNYWIYVIQYMREQQLDFAYWSINGNKRLHESETYGLLQDDNFGVRHPWKLEDLQGLFLNR